ncbi:MAG: hypothetical protein WC682_04360 [Parcubacteria group bacterium]|jgi:hypothetical protein
MAKKRTYSTVLNEILIDLKNVHDYQWKELFSLSKGFHHFSEGLVFARGDYPRWEKKFFEKMVETATIPSHWLSIAHSAERYSPEWNNAVDKLLQDARVMNIANRWINIRLILPPNHACMKEVRSKISDLRNARKKG